MNWGGYMETKRLIWFKEEIIPVSQAKINVLAPTSQFGVNVFEGIRCYWNEEKEQLYAFKLTEHINRLINSAKIMDFDLEYDFNFLKNSFLDIVQSNNFKEDIAVRQTLFLDGFGSWSSKGPVEMFIAPIPKGRPYDKIGIDCCISSFERINDNSLSPRVKVGANYMNSRLGHLEAVKNGYDTAIFLNNQKKVSEGPGSCIFIIRDEKLITPPVTASILESITRQNIIDIAESDLNIRVIERDIDRTELYVCEEAFLCGTAMEITPILTIDRYAVGTKSQGKFTEQIREFYFKMVRGNLKNYNQFLTPIY